jgi:hypothetical protein
MGAVCHGTKWRKGGSYLHNLQATKALNPHAGQQNAEAFGVGGFSMTIAAEDGLRFVPSAVEGLAPVNEVILFPDRLELLSDDKCIVIRFLDIARWHRLGWLYRPLARIGLGVHGSPLVADRDWFHPPPGRFFRFYTESPVTVYMPGESPDTNYAQTMFRRAQDVMRSGGFGTFDFG